MILGQIPRRYAKALLEIGAESGQLDQLVEDMSRVAATYEENAELRGALDNPLFPYEGKKAVIAEVAEKLGLSAAAKNTILLLNDRRRMHSLPQIARALRELFDARKGLVRAEVMTAKPLSAEYVETLRVALERRTGKKIVLEQREDADLLAGVIVRIGDTLFDGSLRGRLSELRSQLLN